MYTSALRSLPRAAARSGLPCCKRKRVPARLTLNACRLEYLSTLYATTSSRSIKPHVIAASHHSITSSEMYLTMSSSHTYATTEN